MLDHLDLLCHHHHRLKTVDNWALVAGRGKRAFVSPRIAGTRGEAPDQPTNGLLVPFTDRIASSEMELLNRLPSGRCRRIRGDPRRYAVNSSITGES